MLLLILIMLSLLVLLIMYILFPGYMYTTRIFTPLNTLLLDSSFDVPEDFQNVTLVSPMIGEFGGPNHNGPSKLLPLSCYWYNGRLFCKV